MSVWIRDYTINNLDSFKFSHTMPPKSTRSVKKQARNRVCAIEIPGTPEAEIFVPTKITESESIPIKDDDYNYNYSYAQPPANNPGYEEMFGPLQTIRPVFCFSPFSFPFSTSSC